MVRAPGLATIYRLTQKLCKAFTILTPYITSPPFTPTEVAALKALQLACQELLAQGALPGYDDDPGTGDGDLDQPEI